jgi:hypothetical protein
MTFPRCQESGRRWRRSGSTDNGVVEARCLGGGGRGTRRHLEEEHEAASGTQAVMAMSSDGGQAQRAWPG